RSSGSVARCKRAGLMAGRGSGHKPLPLSISGGTNATGRLHGFVGARRVSRRGVVDFEELKMQFETLARFVLGVLLGATIWAVSHRARADSIPATANTQTQAATSSVVLQYTVFGYQSQMGWFSSPGGAMAGYVSYRNGAHILC